MATAMLGFGDLGVSYFQTKPGFRDSAIPQEFLGDDGTAIAWFTNGQWENMLYKTWPGLEACDNTHHI